MKTAGLRKMSFADWMTAVDSAAERLVGLSIHDLPDVAFDEMYEDGTSPVSAARRAIRYAKGQD